MNSENFKKAATAAKAGNATKTAGAKDAKKGNATTTTPAAPKQKAEEAEIPMDQAAIKAELFNLTMATPAPLPQNQKTSHKAAHVLAASSELQIAHAHSNPNEAGSMCKTKHGQMLSMVLGATTQS